MEEILNNGFIIMSVEVFNLSNESARFASLLDVDDKFVALDYFSNDEDEEVWFFSEPTLEDLKSKIYKEFDNWKQKSIIT